MYLLNIASALKKILYMKSFIDELDFLKKTVIIQ